MQLPTDFYCVRRHSAGSTPSDSSSTTASWPIRRRSLQQSASSPATVIDGRGSSADLGDADMLEVGCRRRSFSVTPKGDVVNEGDEILPRQGSYPRHRPTFSTALYYTRPKLIRSYNVVVSYTQSDSDVISPFFSMLYNVEIVSWPQITVMSPPYVWLIAAYGVVKLSLCLSASLSVLFVPAASNTYMYASTCIIHVDDEASTDHSCQLSSLKHANHRLLPNDGCCYLWKRSVPPKFLRRRR